jgi:hypothetical protein
MDKVIRLPSAPLVPRNRSDPRFTDPDRALGMNAGTQRKSLIFAAVLMVVVALCAVFLQEPSGETRAIEFDDAQTNASEESEDAQGLVPGDAVEDDVEDRHPGESEVGAEANALLEVPEVVQAILKRTGESPEIWFQYQEELRRTGKCLGGLEVYKLLPYLFPVDDATPSEVVARSAFERLVLPKLTNPEALGSDARTRALQELASLSDELRAVMEDARSLYRLEPADGQVPFAERIPREQRQREEYLWAEEQFRATLERVTIDLTSILGPLKGGKSYLHVR